MFSQLQNNLSLKYASKTVVTPIEITSICDKRYRNAWSVLVPANVNVVHQPFHLNMKDVKIRSLNLPVNKKIYKLKNNWKGGEKLTQNRTGSVLCQNERITVASNQLRQIKSNLNSVCDRECMFKSWPLWLLWKVTLKLTKRELSAI